MKHCREWRPVLEKMKDQFREGTSFNTYVVRIKLFVKKKKKKNEKFEQIRKVTYTVK